VSEAADQHVHIAIPHGFNIGAAGQPPKCRNSLHSHRTAEVFFVLSGRWRFFWGRWGTRRGGAGGGRHLQHPHRHLPRLREHRHRLRDDHGDPRRRRCRRRRDLGAAGDRGGAGHGLVLSEEGKLYDTKKGAALPEGVGPMPC
jgi:hypothetical protein